MIRATLSFLKPFADKGKETRECHGESEENLLEQLFAKAKRIGLGYQDPNNPPSTGSNAGSEHESNEIFEGDHDTEDNNEKPKVIEDDEVKRGNEENDESYKQGAQSSTSATQRKGSVHSKTAKLDKRFEQTYQSLQRLQMANGSRILDEDD